MRSAAGRGGTPAGASVKPPPTAPASAAGVTSRSWTIRWPRVWWSGWPRAVAAARVETRGARLAGATAIAALSAVLIASAPQRMPTRTDRPTARLGVVSFYNPRLMYMKYQPLADYLSQHTPWRVELDLGASYSETVARLCAGEVQLAYLGPLSYLRAVEACGARAIVRLNTGKSATYQSYILVRQDSPIRTLGDLRGRGVGFGARLSTSAHLMPRAMLEAAGLRSGRDFGCHYYGHHEGATRGVLLGEVAACGVRDLVGDAFLVRGLRVLARSGPIPNFPLAIGPASPDGFERAIVQALVELPGSDQAIARLMADWDTELASGFALADPTAYEPVGELARRILGPRALIAPPESLVCGPPATPPGDPKRPRDR